MSTDVCGTASGCAECGSLSWAGQAATEPAQRCVWCESAHTCAPSSGFCAFHEEVMNTASHRWQYASGTDIDLPPLPNERIWMKPVATIIPGNDRHRAMCPDLYFFADDYLIPTNVFDPFHAYAFERDYQGMHSWYDFATSEVSLASCANGLKSGLVRVLDSLRMCTGGSQISGSPTLCEGVLQSLPRPLCMCTFR